MLFVLCIALSANCYAQHVYNGAQVFNGPLTTTAAVTNTGSVSNTGSVANAGTTTNTGVTTFNAGVVHNGYTSIGNEVASTHSYTVTGTKPLVVITATRLDTIRLVPSNFVTGQTIRFLTTQSANDSTCLFPTTGNIMGGSFYWYTGAAGTYKAATLYFDGTNFYKL